MLGVGNVACGYSGHWVINPTHSQSSGWKTGSTSLPLQSQPSAFNIPGFHSAYQCAQGPRRLCPSPALLWTLVCSPRCSVTCFPNIWLLFVSVLQCTAYGNVTWEPRWFRPFVAFLGMAASNGKCPVFLPTATRMLSHAAWVSGSQSTSGSLHVDFCTISWLLGVLKPFPVATLFLLCLFVCFLNPHSDMWPQARLW